jgi:hypothetical protein
MRRRVLTLFMGAILLVGTGAGPGLTQPRGRRVTTVAALRAFPAFYHGEPVLVRGELKAAGDRAELLSPDQVIPLLSRETPSDGEYDVRGEALDVGRLTPNDPRLSGLDLRRLGIDPEERWPRQGEIVVLNATSFERAEPLPSPSIRAIALDPHRYEEQRVTIAGEFRGRNLYGDLPQAPPGADKSRDEFVLRSADAAIWVLGKRPRGRGFSFDVNSRIDTRRWLEVSGVVRYEGGLAWIAAEELQEVEPRRETERLEAPPPPPAPIPPEVVFSVPMSDETDVPPGTNVRIQFSRDLDAESLKGRVRATYVGAESTERGEPQAPRIGTAFRYDPGSRVLEITFEGPLERFRTVTVELLEGITGTDRAPLAPWKLTFSVGG